MSPERETDAVVARYAKRSQGDRYSALRADVWQTLQERQRALLRVLAAQGIVDVSALRVTEVGCGTGGNLLELLRLGFAPENLVGIELLQERHAQARHVLPAATQVLLGDAAQAPIAAQSQDIVVVSTVFSSLLDEAFQRQLASVMWQWLRPGGAVLWYDFTFNNPRNPDVCGVPLGRVRALFPASRIVARRVTLAPPLARLVCAVHPGLYSVFNALPLLRTHVLAWIEKPT
jgi:SAM-dependent methyltransferase